jgi:hypothetical protein
VLDQLVVLYIEERQLRDTAIGMQDSELRALVGDHRRAVLAAADPDSGPGRQLVGDVGDNRFGIGHGPIVSALGVVVRMS